jgi:hypothetical protein
MKIFADSVAFRRMIVYNGIMDIAIVFVIIDAHVVSKKNRKWSQSG